MTSAPRILVVEDHQDTAELFVEVLEDLGFAAEVARTADDALELIAQRSFHLVVANLWTTAAKSTLSPSAAVSRLIDACQPTPVGVLSTLPEQLDEPRLAFVLTKPFGIEPFVAAVAAALEPRLSPAQDAAALAHRYFAALSNRDWSGLGALCADDVVYVLPGASRFAAEVRGRRAFCQFTEETFREFTDARFSDVIVYALPHGVVARYVGTWSSGSSTVAQSGAVVLRVSDGRIAQIGVRIDEARLLRLTARPETPRAPHPPS